MKPTIEDVDDMRIWRIFFADSLECDEFGLSIDTVAGYFKRENLKVRYRSILTDLFCISVNGLDLLDLDEAEEYLEHIGVLAMSKWFFPFDLVTRGNGNKWQLKVIPAREFRQIVETEFGNALCGRLLARYFWDRKDLDEPKTLRKFQYCLVRLPWHLFAREPLTCDIVFS